MQLLGLRLGLRWMMEQGVGLLRASRALCGVRCEPRSRWPRLSLGEGWDFLYGNLTRVSTAESLGAKSEANSTSQLQIVFVGIQMRGLYPIKSVGQGKF